MTPRDERPTDDAPEPAELSSAVVIASSDETYRRIERALAEQGLRASARAESSDVIHELNVYASTVIIFVCNVDAPREIASLRRLHREVPAAIVVISPPATGTGVRRALDAGAHGLVFAPDLDLTLATAVRAVAIGQAVVPRNMRPSVERPALSHRERQVLALVRKGLTNAEIAKDLYLAESTIKSHVSSLFRKVGVRSRREAAAAIIDLEPLPGMVPTASITKPAGRPIT